MSELDKKQNFHRSSVQEQLDMIRTEYQRSGQLPLGLQRLLNSLQNTSESKDLSLMRIQELGQAAFNGEDLLTSYPSDYIRLITNEENQEKFIAVLQKLESNALDMPFLALVPPKPSLYINEKQQWHCEWILTPDQLMTRLQQNEGIEKIELFSGEFKVPEEEGQITVFIQDYELSVSLTVESTLSTACEIVWGTFSKESLSTDEGFSFLNIPKTKIIDKSNQIFPLKINLVQLD